MIGCQCRWRVDPWKWQIALLGARISSDVEIKNEVACRIAKFLDVIKFSK